MAEWSADWVREFDLPKPFYRTGFGAAFLGDAKNLMALMPDQSVDLIVTSPPFALRRKKEYGNVEADKYVAWFLEFARLFHELLKPRGSLVIDIGGSWNPGEPTRSLYHYELLIELCRVPGYKFHLAEEFVWYNPARLPTPGTWSLTPLLVLTSPARSQSIWIEDGLPWSSSRNT